MNKKDDKNFSAFLPQLSRRWLLRSLALASGVAFTSRFARIEGAANARTRQTATQATNLLSELEAVPNPRQPLKVIILGAGMAGLCAAYELEKRGHTCVILEAERSHIGGRVRTLRFEDSLYGEVGASRVSKRHTLTHYYIRECGLQLRPYVMSNPEGYYCLRGQRIRARDAANLSRIYNLSGSESGLTPDDVLGTVIGSRLAQLAEPEKAEIFAEKIQSAAVREMDEQSMLQWCKTSGLSDDAIEMMAAANGFLGDVMYFRDVSILQENTPQPIKPGCRVRWNPL